MAENSEPEGPVGTRNSPTGPEPRGKIRWDESKARNVHANVANVTGRREEIVLLFGTLQSWDEIRKEGTSRVSDSIILSPFLAKRLASALARFLQDYESKFGPLRL